MRTHGTLTLLAALTAAAALGLAGCDDDEGVALDEADETEDPAETDEPEDTAQTDEPEDTESPAEATETDEADDAQETDEPDDAQETDEPEDAEEPNEHRPDEDVEAVADCAKIISDDPGAMIAFPSEEGPGWLDAGPGPVLVEFVGCSNTFEASLAYRAFHGDDSEPSVEGGTSGGAMGDWERFGFEETFWTPGEWTMEVFEVDAASGDEVVYDEVTFTVE